MYKVQNETEWDRITPWGRQLVELGFAGGSDQDFVGYAVDEGKSPATLLVAKWYRQRELAIEDHLAWLEGFYGTADF